MIFIKPFNSYNDRAEFQVTQWMKNIKTSSLYSTSGVDTWVFPSPLSLELSHYINDDFINHIYSSVWVFVPLWYARYEEIRIGGETHLANGIHWNQLAAVSDLKKTHSFRICGFRWKGDSYTIDQTVKHTSEVLKRSGHCWLRGWRRGKTKQLQVAGGLG